VEVEDDDDNEEEEGVELNATLCPCTNNWYMSE
jgi:hypothetical protein